MGRHQHPEPIQQRQPPEARPELLCHVTGLESACRQMVHIRILRDDGCRQVDIQKHADQATHAPEPDLVRRNILPPGTPVFQVFISNRKNLTGRGQLDFTMTEGTRDRANPAAHPKALIAIPVRDHQISNAPGACCRSKGSQ